MKSQPISMKNRIKTLIFFSSLVFILLCAIQYYLVMTTYKYKVAEFKLEVKERLSKITNNYSDIDSSLFYKKEKLYKNLAENYLKNNLYLNQLKHQLINNPFKNELTQKIQDEFDKEFEHNIEFAIVLNKFILYKNGSKADTLVSEKSGIKNKMYGNLMSLKNAFLVRNYVGTTNQTSIKNKYKLLTEDSLYISIQNWEMIILKRMILVLLFSILTILILITIFFITIKSLIKQKKINDIKTDFINNISHELKTPLTTLAISTKILERKETKQNETLTNQVINTISRQNERLQKLIDQVITNSIGYEQIELQKENTNINKLLSNIITDFNTTHQHITIETNFHPSKPNIVLDKFLLSTAITNILENAVKYGSKSISVITNITNEQFSIEITDDGIGIEQQQQIYLFEKFYRVPQGNLHQTKGLGLGLYYVKQIIKAHKGNIKLISELGKGASFTLCLPLRN